METDSNKLWRLTKQLNDEENGHARLTLLQDRKMVQGKQAANIFADTYKEASNIPVELHHQKYVRTEQGKITESDVNSNEFTFIVRRINQRIIKSKVEDVTWTRCYYQ